MRLAAYLALLRAPGAPRVVAAALLGRIPIGMLMLAIVLLARDELGSYALAGALDATFGGASALGAPLLGRAVDRLGQPRVLVPSACLHAAGLAALTTAALLDAPAPAFAAAAVAGLAYPPLSSCMRSLWPRLLTGREELTRTAFALEAILVEVFFITGPLLAAGLAALASPAAAVLAAAALALGGSLVYASAPAARAWRGSTGEEATRGRHRAGALVSPGMRTVVAFSLGLGFAFGTFGVAMTAFAGEHGARPQAGLLIAAQAAGSMVGGFAYGARHGRGTLGRRYLVAAVALVLGVGVIAIGGSLGVMAALMALSGVAIAPTSAAAGELISVLAPAGTVTEAFTWLVAAQVVGAAVGSGTAGAVVSVADWRAAILAAWGVASAGALVLFLRRRTLGVAVSAPVP